MTKTIKIIFYKGKESFLGKLIRIWTFSPYSHCEFLFDTGVAFSAYPFKGTYWRFIGWTPDPKKWDSIELKIMKSQEEEIKNFFKEEEKCDYDWIGIFLSQVIFMGRQSKTKWFCSEICSAALKKIGLLSGYKAHEISPGRLYRILKKRYSPGSCISKNSLT